MKILTYATNLNHTNIKLLQNKIGVELLPNYIPWDMNFYAKAYSINSYIDRYEDDELILCCDCYDVLPVNGCTKEFLNDAIVANFDLNKVTFNAEINCYPKGDLSRYYPTHASKWKYLNAGIFVGKKQNIKIMYDLVLDKIKNSMDQLQFSLLFLNSDKINLDYECKVFQTLYNGRVSGPMNMDDFIIDNKTITNKYFNTKPLLFHGNGHTDMTPLKPFI